MASQNFPIAQVFLTSEEGVPLELGTGTGDQKCEWWGNRAEISLTVTSTYVTNRQTDTGRQQEEEEDIKENNQITPL